MLQLNKLSETASKITLGWTPVPGAVGYRFQSSTQAPKWSHTFDPSRSQATFSKAQWYKVEALGVKDAGKYPTAQPAPPPTKTFHRKADFGYFFNGQGASDIADGVRFRADTTTPAPWEANSKICQGAQLDGLQTIRPGDHVLWTARLRYPASLNQQGFTGGFWKGNVLMEFGTTGGSVGHEFMISNDGRLFFYLREAPTQFPTLEFYYPDPVELDAEYAFEWEQKWSYGSDGFMRGSINGQEVVRRSGPTMWNGEQIRHLGIGWYSVKKLVNAVDFLELQYALL